VDIQDVINAALVQLRADFKGYEITDILPAAQNVLPQHRGNPLFVGYVEKEYLPKHPKSANILSSMCLVSMPFYIDYHSYTSLSDKQIVKYLHTAITLAIVAVDAEIRKYQ